MHCNVYNTPMAYKCAYMDEYPPRVSVPKTAICQSKWLLVGRIGFKCLDGSISLGCSNNNRDNSPGGDSVLLSLNMAGNVIISVQSRDVT